MQTWHNNTIELTATLAVLRKFGTVSLWQADRHAAKKLDALVKEGMAQFDHQQEVWRPL